MTDTFAHLRGVLGDRYDPVRELGGGGMALVYLAEDRKHQRQVAIKVLRPEFSVSLAAERFLREIAVVARLQHPHILPLLDSGSAPVRPGWSGVSPAGGAPWAPPAPTADLLYFVMPFMDGESLRARIAREGQLPLPQVVRILGDVADALAYAHGKGVVHRDIKPDNIMLSGRHAVVMDFGVAKAVSDSTVAPADLTAGVALGTPAYMAPEQATADPALDHRVDIYALGILGYEMLTGRPPFRGATVHELLTAQVLDDPEPIETLRPDVPPALAALVLRCLEKRPDDRWSDAAMVTAQLEPFSTGSGGMTPATVTPVPSDAPLLPRWLLTTVAVLGLVAIGFLVHGARAMMMHPLELRQATILGTVTEAALSPDGQFIALVARGQGDSTRLGVQEAAGGTPRWLTSGLYLRDPSWSRDGTELRFVSYDAPGVFVVRGIPRLGGQPRYIAPMIGDYPAFSADDRSLASFRASTADLSIRNLATGDTTSIRAPAGYRWSVGAAWAPGGDWIALTLFGFDARHTAIACLSTDGRSTHLLVQDSVELSAPVWPSGGDALYYLRQEGALQALRRLTLSGDCQRKGAPEEVAAGLDIGDRTPGLPTAASLSLTHDGRRLSYLRSVKSSNLWIRSTTETSASPLTTGTAYNYSARFGPGDSLLAFIRDTDGEGSVLVLPLRSMIESPVGGSAGAVGLGWSADGDALAVTTESGERPASVVVIQPRMGTRKPLATALSSAGLAWLNDGRIVYQVAGNRGFSIVDTMTGQVAPLATIDTAAGFVFAPKVSPDGKQLAFFWARATDRGLWLTPFDGPPARPLVAGTLLDPLRWSADGRRLFVAEGGRNGSAPLISVLTLETGQLRPLLMLERGDLVEDVSREGRTVLFSRVETQSDIWLLENPTRSGQ